MKLSMEEFRKEVAKIPGVFAYSKQTGERQKKDGIAIFVTNDDVWRNRMMAVGQFYRMVIDVGGETQLPEGFNHLKGLGSVLYQFEVEGYSSQIAMIKVARDVAENEGATNLLQTMLPGQELKSEDDGSIIVIRPKSRPIAISGCGCCQIQENSLK